MFKKYLEKNKPNPTNAIIIRKNIRINNSVSTIITRSSYQKFAFTQIKLLN
jgi:hypothetical protein